jgi:hypothetical protein
MSGGKHKHLNSHTPIFFLKQFLKGIERDNDVLAESA